MINLLFCGNNGIRKGLAMGLLSIAKYCKEDLNVIVLTMDLHEIKNEYIPLSQEYVDSIENELKKVNPNSKINLVDITRLFQKENSNSVNMDNMYSPYAFIRLLADEVEQIGDKILYLDTDVCANKDISELYNIDVSDVEYAAVKDYYGKVFIRSKYVNSGVMLYNMKEIRKSGLFKKCRNFVNTKKAVFPDQTALNKFVTKKKILPSKYNSQRRLKKNDVIRHFCKSVRWYPAWRVFNKKYKNLIKNYPRFFPLIHTLNVKPWDKEAMHKKLKCYAFDDIIEKVEKLENKIN